ncbi:eukaryotic translation initiation factor 3 subunit D-like [Raphidocelis subcapitata]|uniref:Eukaryotic translation initiation factor 3 subunit D-like n=1 Tax=Raphidocelis subcapitata TaxID=307507 RepID=A0A2V0PMX3_9CHLO|nr:eukaryotic translation initiation factor 3 subunit D-like [Raphidocelis subcapitata]|eukprot:GBG00453.1 eukaryotic translation initiation factor 3 subunit D-like [Raphidocelis subcapitata]
MPGTGIPYSVPELHDNSDGWGPSTVPEHLQGVPFAPFSKTDKLGKAADWTNTNFQKYSGRYNQNPVATVFTFFQNEEVRAARRSGGGAAAAAADDPVLRRLASEGAARVFATDAVLSSLMCARSSVYSWDVVLTRAGESLFIDKRDGGPLDLLTVNETAPEQIPEDRDNINGTQQLALEATAVNQSLSQQLLAKDGGKHELGAPNPFAGEEGEDLASAGYRYRKWTLGPNGPEVAVRCEVNAALTTPKGEVQLASLKALNEWNLKETDWRKKLDQSRASMLLTEAKNNKNKMARWTAEAIMAGAEAIKWGYVSRAGLKDNSNHAVLNVQTSKPRDFASQIQLSMDHCWGVVRALVDLALAQPEGKYLLLKDPNKELLRLYAVPGDAFEAHYADE